MIESVEQTQEWTTFHQDRLAGNYPKWPNEAMLKVLFGSYLKTPNRPQASWKVLDVGCGFGNNMVPFCDLGCETHGVEIDPEISSLTAKLLERRGYNAVVMPGHNRELPYPDASFDLLLSVNALHYEGDAEKIDAAIAEFRRVLKPGGMLFISTVGARHTIAQRAKPLGEHRFEIQNFDFRNGQIFYFFDGEDDLARTLGKGFSSVETGVVTEKLMTMPLEFLIAAARV